MHLFHFMIFWHLIKDNTKSPLKSLFAGMTERLDLEIKN